MSQSRMPTLQYNSGSAGTNPIPPVPAMMAAPTAQIQSLAVVVQAPPVAPERARRVMPATLAEQVKLLKYELSLKGHIKQVVDNAAAQLGVSTRTGNSNARRPLTELSRECLAALGYT